MDGKSEKLGNYSNLIKNSFFFLFFFHSILSFFVCFSFFLLISVSSNFVTRTLEFDVSAFVVFSLHLFPRLHITFCFFIIFSWNSQLILDYFLYSVYCDDIRCTLCVSICFWRWCWYSLLSQFFPSNILFKLYIYLPLLPSFGGMEWNGKWKNENGKTLFFSIFVTVILFSVTDFYCFQQYVLPFFHHHHHQYQYQYRYHQFLYYVFKRNAQTSHLIIFHNLWLCSALGGTIAFVGFSSIELLLLRMLCYQCSRAVRVILVASPLRSTPFFAVNFNSYPIILGISIICVYMLLCSVICNMKE